MPVAPSQPATAQLPLAGVRVVAFTWVWAGPVAGMQLAHLGADVIRVESRLRMDTLRAGVGPHWQGQPGPNRSGYVNQYSQGKRSISLNLKEPRAVELAYALIRQADVVLDNFGAGALERMGFGYEKLRSIKSDIIQVSMAGHGQTGPIAKYVAYGPTQVPSIGLASLTGYPGGGPREVGISYGDPNGGLCAAIAMLAALRHRRLTDEGQYVDMSQWEAAIPLVAEGILTYQMTGQQPARMGNRDEFEAPQGVFRCTGDDRWVALSCWSDVEWQALASAIGRADLAVDRSFARRSGRKAREAELEEAISAWTSQRSADDAAAGLRAAGVPAQPVFTTKDVADDPELALRDFWVQLPHPETQGAQHIGIPWQMSGTPLKVRKAAPALGEHTDEILAGVLQLPEEEIRKLREAGVLE
jgi:benzylsuccinate CoA-transferase BbsF subunit